ncbi:uncharacterized protein BYT42DRAFT_573585 [Radiomyces spectabilis]|uniref:uncharacterized protein n=1 Tax=Radiomyces spectabilis TaxID=64574 RepID=UPI00221FAC1B|nr:uncharacterized protein BYT42DRAFT_573585 [Radiomyces spectabilis]KAI8376146.1 hypothetical protein BYT42DRAFT_573585 [Radiomyces spectabilis]
MTSIKLAPIIHSASVTEFNEREQHIWYSIKVIPMLHRDASRNASLVTPLRKTYTISRRYEDFEAFAQKLHDQFSSSEGAFFSRSRRFGMTTQSLPIPKIKTRLNLLPAHKKQIHVQRQAELNKFIHTLLSLDPTVTQSLCVREFFGWHRVDIEQRMTSKKIPLRRARLTRSRSHLELQDRRKKKHVRLHRSLSQPDLSITCRADDHLVRRSVSPTCWIPTPPAPSTSTSRWKLLRPQRHHPSPSLSSLCTQAVHKIMPWTTRRTSLPSSDTSKEPIPMPSPPLPLKRCDEPRMTGIDAISCVSTSSSSSSFSSAISPTVSHIASDRIKMKIVYDMDNIVVVQVPRSIELHELRRRIQQKFSEPNLCLGPHFNLLYHNARSSASSCCSEGQTTGIIISQPEDLLHAMTFQWDKLEKITLRCILV